MRKTKKRLYTVGYVWNARVDTQVVGTFAGAKDAQDFCEESYSGAKVLIWPVEVRAYRVIKPKEEKKDESKLSDTVPR